MALQDLSHNIGLEGFNWRESCLKPPEEFEKPTGLVTATMWAVL